MKTLKLKKERCGAIVHISGEKYIWWWNIP